MIEWRMGREQEMFWVDELPPLGDWDFQERD
jgi:hypothetical protein